MGGVVLHSPWPSVRRRCPSVWTVRIVVTAQHPTGHGAPSMFAQFSVLFGYRLPPPLLLAVCLNQAGIMHGGSDAGQHILYQWCRRLVSGYNFALGRGDMTARKRRCAAGTDAVWLRPYCRTESEALNHRLPAPILSFLEERWGSRQSTILQHIRRPPRSGVTTG